MVLLLRIHVLRVRRVIRVRHVLGRVGRLCGGDMVIVRSVGILLLLLLQLLLLLLQLRVVIVGGVDLRRLLMLALKWWCCLGILRRHGLHLLGRRWQEVGVCLELLVSHVGHCIAIAILLLLLWLLVPPIEGLPVRLLGAPVVVVHCRADIGSPKPSGRRARGRGGRGNVSASLVEVMWSSRLSSASWPPCRAARRCQDGIVTCPSSRDVESI